MTPRMTPRQTSSKLRPLPARVLAAAALAILLGACASTPMPVEQLAVAEAAVKRASTTSTSQAAPAELGVAVAKLANARNAVTTGDADRARRMADEAIVDAQYAELRAQSAGATRAARETQEAARVLREEINRKTVR